ncbi:cell division protein ZapA (FtsZ GTPase activity inhibitor), partial [Clostridium sardiniense]
MIRITVNINGVDYNLKGKESEDYLRDIASYVDERIKEILGKNPMLSISQASVLAAVNITDELYKSDNEIKNLVSIKNNIENEKGTLFKTIEELKSNITRLKEENINLKESKDSAINRLKDDREALLKELNEIKEDRNKLKSDISNFINNIKS